MSSAFFFDKQAACPNSKPTKIEARLLEAADFWGISAPGVGLKEKAADAGQDDLSKLPDEDFAWVQGRERHLPLRNALEVKAAAEYLHKWRDEFAFADAWPWRERSSRRPRRWRRPRRIRRVPGKNRRVRRLLGSRSGTAGPRPGHAGSCQGP